MMELRPTHPADLPALSALFAERFGHPLSLDEWDWKYRRLPGLGRSRVAVDGAGAVVAHAGALRLPARWRGGEAGIWQLVDFLAASRQPGLRPVLVDLGRQLLADIPGAGDVPWIFGFPSERHFRLGERVFAYLPIGNVQPLAAPLPQVSGEGVEIEVGDSCGPWAEAVWESCGVLGVRRSAAFLNWRYHARPGRYYRFYRLAAGGGEGLAVFAFVGAEARAAELWLPAGGEWYPSMLAVAADLRAAGLAVWRFWPRPGTPPGGPDPLLASLGLAPAGEPRFIGCRGCRGRPGSPEPALAGEGFTYSMGDYDLV